MPTAEEIDTVADRIKKLSATHDYTLEQMTEEIAAQYGPGFSDVTNAGPGFSMPA